MEDVKDRILIVDDQPKNIQILGNMLKEHNYDIEFALNGNSAIDCIRKRDFDLILLDIMMPEMDGFEVGQLIKNTPHKSQIPIIYLTAKNDEDSIVKGFETGAVDYITKPFDQKELLARLSAHLSLKKTKDKLKLHNKYITDSIKYAKRIQSAMLPYEELKRAFPDSFLIDYPRDIVSGDFFWVKETENLTFLSIADCTGHGVPGAFMSILGISLLNELINVIGLEKASSVLNVLRERVKDALHQSYNEKDIKDGMDISLCIFKKGTYEMQFSGAFSTIYILRNKNIIEYKGDRQPIGAYEEEKKFTNQIISLLPDDRVFLFTDGIIDQIGGKDFKKLKNKTLKQYILDTGDYSIKKQGDIIRRKFEKWKGNNTQVDDVLIVGIRI